MAVKDYPDFGTPQAHADSIAATGAPLLRLSQSVKFNIGSTIAGGASSTLVSAGAFTQPGYEMTFTASMPAGTGTLPFVALELTWSDPVTSLITARTDVVVTAGNGPANEVTSFLNGPARGGNLKLVATNVDPAVTVTLDWQVSQTSHIYEHEQAGQTAYPVTAPNGFTNPPGISGTGVLARVHSSLAAGNSASFLCALHGGDALLTLDDAGLGSPVQVALADAAGFASGTVSGEFLSMQATAGTGEAMLITLPFTPMLLTVSNTGTVGPISPRAALLAQNH